MDASAQQKSISTAFSKGSSSYSHLHHPSMPPLSETTISLCEEEPPVDDGRPTKQPSAPPPDRQEKRSSSPAVEEKPDHSRQQSPYTMKMSPAASSTMQMSPLVDTAENSSGGMLDPDESSK